MLSGGRRRPSGVGGRSSSAWTPSNEESPKLAQTANTAATSGPEHNDENMRPLPTRRASVAAASATGVAAPSSSSPSLFVSPGGAGGGNGSADGMLSTGKRRRIHRTPVLESNGRRDSAAEEDDEQGMIVTRGGRSLRHRAASSEFQRPPEKSVKQEPQQEDHPSSTRRRSNANRMARELDTLVQEASRFNEGSNQSSHAQNNADEFHRQQEFSQSPEVVGGRATRSSGRQAKPSDFKKYFQEDDLSAALLDDFETPRLRPRNEIPASTGDHDRSTDFRASRAVRFRNRNLVVSEEEEEDDMEDLYSRRKRKPKPPVYDLDKLKNEYENVLPSNTRMTRGKAIALVTQQQNSQERQDGGNDDMEEEYVSREQGPGNGRGDGGSPYALRERRVKKLVSYADKNGTVSPSRTEYSLRPRTETVNYRVRIPLYEASPKKTESRRKSGRHSQFKAFGDDMFHGGSGAFGFKFGGGASSNSRFPSSSVLLGPSFGEDSSDEDTNSAVKDRRRAADLRVSDAGPINRGALGGGATDIERLLLGKRGPSLSDNDPLAVDQSVDFSKVGGLNEHIKSLKEMILLPLLYPEVFTKFNLAPPRGVLFHGPPGTGKTLLARALANACSTETQKVAFFMRKGADVLNKWVGESERQLKNLFEQARLMQPSIIFFDEIDGLAPVRSAKQDQIHASIVTTLLALMDGLDSRGQVIVIGATNRIDSIDSALRRPGRFDREFYFPLPSRSARKDILRIHTGKWEPALEEDLVEQLSDATKGYCGSDLKALCTEATLRALERRYPQIYASADKLKIDVAAINVERQDFAKCIKTLVPASYRVKASVDLPLPQHLQPLLADKLGYLLSLLKNEFPVHSLKLSDTKEENIDGHHGNEVSLVTGTHSLLQIYRPRLVLTSSAENGQRDLACAILNSLEGIHVHTLDLSTVFGDTSRTAEAAIVQFFLEVRRRKPGIVFVPNFDTWWTSLSDVAKRLVEDQLDQLAPHDPILFLATARYGEMDAREVFQELKINADSIVTIRAPKRPAIVHYFDSALLEALVLPTGIIASETDGTCSVIPTEFSTVRMPKVSAETLAPLPKAAPAPPRKLTAKEIRLLHEYDESVFRRLRIILRDFLHEFLRCKDYKSMTKNLNSVEDYGDIVKYDGQDILEKVERNGYQTVKHFRKDLLETLESFRRLAYHRHETFRLTYVNALVDVLEDWMRVIDPALVHETNESYQREKRLKKEYEDLRRTQYQQFQAQYQASMSNRKSGDTDGWDSSGELGRNGPPPPSGTRASRRLRGENLDWSEIALVDTDRKVRRSTDQAGEEGSAPFVSADTASLETIAEATELKATIEEHGVEADVAVSAELDENGDALVTQETTESIVAEAIEEAGVDMEGVTETIKEDGEEITEESMATLGDDGRAVEEEAVQELPTAEEGPSVRTEEDVQESDVAAEGPITQEPDVAMDVEETQPPQVEVEPISMEMQAEDVIDTQLLSDEPILIPGVTFPFQNREDARKRIAERLATSTEGRSVEELEKFRTVLLRTIYHWRQSLVQAAQAVLLEAQKQQQPGQANGVAAGVEENGSMPAVEVMEVVADLEQELIKLCT